MNNVRLNENLIKTLGSVIRMSSAEMIADTGIPSTTWYNIIKKPAVITVQQLLAFANGLRIPVSRFFSAGEEDLIGKREDYITEPYIQCRYDDVAMRELVSKRPDASWQKAADIAGMSRSRMRNSMLAVTRTPVVRFLKTCKDFDIDPFSVLIDPNPKTKRKHKAAASASAFDNDGHDIIAEIAALRQQIANANAVVSELKRNYEDLSTKYDNLLDVHKTLLARFDKHTEVRYVDMAAESDG